MRLRLASKSAARAGILSNAGLAFDIVSAGVDEAPLKLAALSGGHGPLRIAELLAEAKAVAASRGSPDPTIGADQTLDVDGELFDKAETLEQARDNFLRLRGRRHQLHSAVVLAQDGQVIWRNLETATLVLRNFSDAFLDDYLARNAEIALSCAGGYALEGEGVQLFEAVAGDYFAILGLQILPLLRELRRLELVPA